MNPSLRHYLGLVSSQAIRIPLGILNVALLARIAGPEGIGRWAMVAAATTILHSVLINWTQAANVRFGREEWTRTGTLRRTWSGRWPWLALGLSLSFVCLLLVPLTPVGRFMQLPPSWWPLLVGHLAGLWFMAEAQSLFQVTGRMGRLAAAPLVAMAGSTVSLAFIYWMGGGVAAALAALVVNSVVVWGAAWVAEFRQAGGGWPAADMAAVKESFLYGWPVIPAFLIGYASDWGDHLILQWWATPGQVGLFQVAYQSMLLGIGLAAPMTTVLLPRLIDRNATDPAAARSYVARVFPTLSILWAIAVLPVLAVFPRAFVSVVGPRFAAAVPILAILLVAVPGAAVLQMYTVLFSLQGRLHKTAVYGACMAGTDLALTMLLLPRWGAPAAAVGTATSYLLSQTLYVLDQHRYLGVPVRRIGVVLAGMTVIAVAQAAVGPSWSSRLLVTAAGMTVLVFLARHEGIADPRVLRAVLSGRVAWAADWSARVLRATPGP